MPDKVPSNKPSGFPFVTLSTADSPIGPLSFAWESILTNPAAGARRLSCCFPKGSVPYFLLENKMKVL